MLSQQGRFKQASGTGMYQIFFLPIRKPM